MSYQILGHKIKWRISQTAHKSLVGEAVCATELIRNNPVYDHNLSSGFLYAVGL